MQSYQNRGNRRRCAHPGCDKIPTYGKRGSRIGVWCAPHAMEGTVNVVSKKCTAPECGKRATHGVEGSKTRLRCGRHSLPGMADLNNKKCARAGCSKRARHGIHGIGKGGFCASHAMDGIADVVNSMCSGLDCLNVATHGRVDGSKRWELCAEHASMAMVSPTVVGTKCSVKGCLEGASYGAADGDGGTRERCAKHSLSGMPNGDHERKCAQQGCSKRARNTAGRGELGKEIMGKYCDAHEGLEPRCRVNDLDGGGGGDRVDDRVDDPVGDRVSVKKRPLECPLRLEGSPLSLLTVFRDGGSRTNGKRDPPLLGEVASPGVRKGNAATVGSCPGGGGGGGGDGSVGGKEGGAGDGSLRAAAATGARRGSIKKSRRDFDPNAGAAEAAAAWETVLAGGFVCSDASGGCVGGTPKRGKLTEDAVATGDVAPAPGAARAADDIAAAQPFMGFRRNRRQQSGVGGGDGAVYGGYGFALPDSETGLMRDWTAATVPSMAAMALRFQTASPISGERDPCYGNRGRATARE